MLIDPMESKVRPAHDPLIVDLGKAPLENPVAYRCTRNLHLATVRS